MVSPIFNDLGVSLIIVEASKFYGEYAGENTRIRGRHLPAYTTYILVRRPWWFYESSRIKPHPMLVMEAHGIVSFHQESWNHMGMDQYLLIHINTIFSGMNIHLPAILMFTRGTRFWHTATWNPIARHVVLWVFRGSRDRERERERDW